MEERDKLLAEIAALEERENYYGAQVVGSGDDLEKAAAFAAELSATQVKIAAKKEQLEQLDNAATNAQGALMSQFDNITFGDETYSIRAFTTDEQAAQALIIWFQEYVGNMAQQNATVISSYQSQVEKLQDTVSERELRVTYLEQEVSQVKEELEDIKTKRDAAATELAETQEETKRLATDNESLRKQLEASNKPSQTNSTTSASQALAEWKASRPAVYDVIDQSNGDKLATLLETGEQVKWEKIYPGKYRIASAEEVERFREEAAATVEVPASVEEEHIPDSTLVVEPQPAIPSESENAGVQTDSTPGKVVPEAVSRAEFQALKDEVDSIKRTLNIELAA